MADRVALDLVIHGRVQGVFFRAFVRSAAERHGVAGRAVNCDDGTVAVHLEGEPDAVDAVASACAHGPDRARVARIDRTDATHKGLTGFTTA